ncbi:hypothetical protein B0T17DRAFT_505853 [Bombardia bombarda]|uniref:Uncharacterized protein n=1 Tax=Bombardia bombarda TaxID=252184 RepID=A0AA40C8B4_9PEZI|nr:hypothetical protein B0T17DRAFT_505853 [Bombardia bombarda]
MSASAPALPSPTPTSDPPPATSLAARSIIGPLTSTFTPPSACAKCIVSQHPDTIWAAHCSAYQADCLDNWQCLPESWKFDGRAFYSPGLYCPDGWQTNAVVISGTYVPDIPMSDIVKLLEADETAALCCPPSYTLHPGGYASDSQLDIFPICYIPETEQAGDFDYATCVNGVLDDNALTEPGSSVQTATYDSGLTSLLDTMMGSILMERSFSSSSKSSSPSSNSTSLLGSVIITPLLTTTSETGSQSGTGQTSISAAASASTSTLSTGALAGIIVSSSIAALMCCIGIITWLIWVKRKRRREADVYGNGDGAREKGPPLHPSELAVEDATLMAGTRTELDGSTVGPKYVELPSPPSAEFTTPPRQGDADPTSMDGIWELDSGEMRIFDTPARSNSGRLNAERGGWVAAAAADAWKP